MRCALVLFSNAAFEGIFRVQVSGAPGSTVVAISWFASKPGRNLKLRSAVVGLQMWESRQRFPSLALLPGVICRPSRCVHLWYCWQAISLSFEQHRPGHAHHLLASATVATCGRLQDVRLTSHVLRPEDCLVFCSSTVCAPARRVFVNTCCLVCWCRSAFACLR